MPRVFTFGETIYDIIFRNDLPVAAVPGGAMLNAAVSLGRAGINAKLISEIGHDNTGRLILDFLKENNVGTGHIQIYPSGKTPVSLARINERGDASYDFYKSYPEKRLGGSLPGVAERDIILFGSFYSLDIAVRDKLTAFVRESSSRGALIIYDPNIRANHRDQVSGLIGLVEENISLADIVRASDEDVLNLFGTTDKQEAWGRISGSGCRCLILTRNAEGVELIAPSAEHHFEVPVIKPVSTIGAGDSFNAGIIYGLLKTEVSAKDLSSVNTETWKRIVSYGTAFAKDACMGWENFISLKFAADMRTSDF